MDFKNLSHGQAVMLVSAIIIGIPLVIGTISGNIPQDQQPAEVMSVTATEQEEKNAQAEREEERRKGFHCLSAWNGSNAALVEIVEQGLRDPGSFEHHRTWIQPVSAQGHHRIKMVFRARNGFGGMNVAEAVGYVDQATCNAVLEKVTDLS